MVTAVSDHVRLNLLSPLVPASEMEIEFPPATGLAWDRVMEELVRLQSLPADWDGQGSLPPSAANHNQALAWVGDMRRWRRALPPTAVVPGVNGEVILEWRGAGYYLAAEISDCFHIEWLLRTPGHAMKQWDTDLRSLWIVSAETARQPSRA